MHVSVLLRLIKLSIDTLQLRNTQRKIHHFFMEKRVFIEFLQKTLFAISLFRWQSESLASPTNELIFIWTSLTLKEVVVLLVSIECEVTKALDVIEAEFF